MFVQGKAVHGPGELSIIIEDHNGTAPIKLEGVYGTITVPGYPAPWDKKDKDGNAVIYKETKRKPTDPVGTPDESLREEFTFAPSSGGAPTKRTRVEWQTFLDEAEDRRSDAEKATPKGQTPPLIGLTTCPYSIDSKHDLRKYWTYTIVFCEIWVYFRTLEYAGFGFGIKSMGVILIAFMEILCLVDCFIEMRTTYRPDHSNGEIVTARPKIWVHYWENPKSRYAEIIASLPFFAILTVLSTSAGMPKTLGFYWTGKTESGEYYFWTGGLRASAMAISLLRTVFLPRILRFTAKNSSWPSIQLANVCFIVVLVVHASACFVFFGSDTTTFYGHDPYHGWANQFRTNVHEGEIFMNKYLDKGTGESITMDQPDIYWYFAYKIITILMGDFASPLTRLEAFISLFLTIIGNIIIGTILGLLVNIFNRYQFLTNRRNNKIDNVTASIGSMEMTKGLKDRIIEYYRFKWYKDKFVNYQDFIGELPTALGEEITSSLYAKTLLGCEIFKGCTQPFAELLSTKLKPAVYTPGSIIIHMGDSATHVDATKLYLISRGKVQIQIPTDEKYDDGQTKWEGIDTQNEGCFGVVGLVAGLKASGALIRQAKTVEEEKGEVEAGDEGSDTKSTTRNWSVVAEQYCDLFTLTADDVLKCCEIYPKDLKTLMDNIKDYMLTYMDRLLSTGVGREMKTGTKKLSFHDEKLLLCKKRISSAIETESLVIEMKGSGDLDNP